MTDPHRHGSSAHGGSSGSSSPARRQSGSRVFLQEFLGVVDYEYALSTQNRPNPAAGPRLLRRSSGEGRSLESSLAAISEGAGGASSSSGTAGSGAHHHWHQKDPVLHRHRHVRHHHAEGEDANGSGGALGVLPQDGDSPSIDPDEQDGFTLIVPGDDEDTTIPHEWGSSDLKNSNLQLHQHRSDDHDLTVEDDAELSPGGTHVHHRTRHHKRHHSGEASLPDCVKESDGDGAGDGGRRGLEGDGAAGADDPRAPDGIEIGEGVAGEDGGSEYSSSSYVSWTSTTDGCRPPTQPSQIEIPRTLNDLANQPRWKEHGHYDSTEEADDYPLRIDFWQLLVEFLYLVTAPWSFMWKEGWVGLGRRNFWRLPERVGEVGKKTSPLPHPTNESGCPPNRMVRFQWLFFAYRNFIFFTAVVLVIGKTQGLGMLAIDLFHALYFHCGLCFLVALKLAVRSPAAQRRLFSDAERRDEEILYGWIPFHRPVAQFETDLAMRRTQLVSHPSLNARQRDLHRSSMMIDGIDNKKAQTSDRKKFGKSFQKGFEILPPVEYMEFVVKVEVMGTLVRFEETSSKSLHPHPAQRAQKRAEAEKRLREEAEDAVFDTFCKFLQTEDEGALRRAMRLQISEELTYATAATSSRGGGSSAASSPVDSRTRSGLGAGVSVPKNTRSNAGSPVEGATSPDFVSSFSKSKSPAASSPAGSGTSPCGDGQHAPSRSRSRAKMNDILRKQPSNSRSTQTIASSKFSKVSSLDAQRPRFFLATVKINLTTLLVNLERQSSGQSGGGPGAGATAIKNGLSVISYKGIRNFLLLAAGWITLIPHLYRWARERDSGKRTGNMLDTDNAETALLLGRGEDMANVDGGRTTPSFLENDTFLHILGVVFQIIVALNVFALVAGTIGQFVVSYVLDLDRRRFWLELLRDLLEGVHGDLIVSENLDSGGSLFAQQEGSFCWDEGGEQDRRVVVVDQGGDENDITCNEDGPRGRSRSGDEQGGFRGKSRGDRSISFEGVHTSVWPGRGKTNGKTGDLDGFRTTGSKKKFFPPPAGAPGGGPQQLLPALAANRPPTLRRSSSAGSSGAASSQQLRAAPSVQLLGCSSTATASLTDMTSSTASEVETLNSRKTDGNPQNRIRTAVRLAPTGANLAAWEHSRRVLLSLGASYLLRLQAGFAFVFLTFVAQFTVCFYVCVIRNTRLRMHDLPFFYFCTAVIFGSVLAFYVATMGHRINQILRELVPRVGDLAVETRLVLSCVIRRTVDEVFSGCVTAAGSCSGGGVVGGSVTGGGSSAEQIGSARSSSRKKDSFRKFLSSERERSPAAKLPTSPVSEYREAFEASGAESPEALHARCCALQTAFMKDLWHFCHLSAVRKYYFCEGGRSKSSSCGALCSFGSGALTKCSNQADQAEDELFELGERAREALSQSLEDFSTSADAIIASMEWWNEHQPLKCLGTPLDYASLVGACAVLFGQCLLMSQKLLRQ